ncbi:hypothetical protein KO533_19025 [Shewanella sp. NKUCC05_KAH]|uniref:hypothetical protein n=1 Tax=Shewanella sp. NKUCC05_KAH TaxID=2842126 RepID=UPI001C5B60AA|nr:hypothetical protein [Shewanella sp. NKUCC05_KAH]MBW3528645.1 hypothetical protein [Shewanella sp. NKUCC05_KAH]
MRVWILRVLGFLLGGFVGVLFVGIIASLTNRVALAMVIIPILSGIAGSRLLVLFCNDSDSFGGRLITKFWSASPAARALVVAPAFWIACVGVFVWLFEPYGGYMSSSDYTHMYKVMLFPPLLLAAGSIVYFKLVKPKAVASRKEI